MKKVVILSYTLGVGGIEKYVSSLCHMLQDNFKIKIICTYKVQDRPAFPLSDKIEIEYLIDGKKDGESLKELIRQKKILSIAKELIRRFKIKYQEKFRNIKVVKSLDCDYLITTRIFHHKIVHKYLRNKKVITIATDHNDHNNNKKYINDLLSSVSTFDYFVICTKKLYDDYTPYLPNTKCIYIPNFLDEISNEKTNFNQKNIISVGRFSPEKGFLDLMEIMALIHQKDSDIKLFLLGDGFQKKEIEEALKKWNLDNSVVMPGFVSLADQKDYYLNSSLYVMTSYTECFGLVLLESMNYGVPCIAFDSAIGAKELILEDVGMIIENRDKEMMAQKIVELVNNQKKLFNYQKNIGSYINNFSIDKIKKDWLTIIK